MKRTNTYRSLFAFLLVFMFFGYEVQAQMASGQPKFVGNIFGNTVPVNFDTYWNQITPENSGKWGTVEGARDVMNWSDLDLAYTHAQNNGFLFKQHAFVWGMQEPTWVGTLPPAEQAAEVEEWIAAYAARYPATDMIDVVNEPLHVIPSYADAIGGNGSTGWDWVVWSFQKARQYMPNAQLILNDYGILGKRKATTDYLKIINILKAQNLIDGIGVQAHGLEYAQNSAILSSLDDLAATGLPVYITELELEFADDQDQLNRYQSLFPLLYEHPGVAGVTLWGYIAGQHWKPDAYLLGEVNTLGTWTVTTAFQDYTVSGAGEVQVHLTNDNVENSNDLEVDYVLLDGATFQAEDMAINTGTWQDNSCGGSFSQWMHCDGYIQFPAASNTVTVRARGVNGTESMEVHAVDMSVERPALQWLRYTYFGQTNTPPVASFSLSSTLLTAEFDGSASGDSDGSVTAWEWDFGDGTTGSGQTVSHTYAASGSYTVTLTVTDDGGATDNEVQEITVSDGNSVPVAAFTYSTNLLSASFDGSGSTDSDGSISSWQWDFGDGSSGSGAAVNHTYATSGSYTVTLTVSDDGGANDTESQLVSVSDGTGPSSQHVNAIVTYTLSAGKGSKYGVAEVTVHDEQENPVPNAQVTGTFSGSYNETVTGNTQSDGKVILQTVGTANGGVTVDLCVDGVTHTSLVYDPTQNDITCTGAGARSGESLIRVATGNLSVYPNPSPGGSFHLAFPESALEESYVISIMDMQGKEVYQSNVRPVRHLLQMNADLPQGMYILRVRGSGLNLQSKLIVR